ncbi:MAG: flagellar biosynthesis anti-sigma factor FlgM [Pirellulaceae bacterium]|nr:flagellar biosynthesis anti-sigma factor FlgM [Pirellulaceae bacterium]
MYVNGSASVHGPQSINAPHRSHQGVEAPKQIEKPSATDQLDISPEAQLLSQARELPDIRADKVADIRKAISEGTYDTDEKMEIALNRLFDEIG